MELYLPNVGWRLSQGEEIGSIDSSQKTLVTSESFLQAATSSKDEWQGKEIGTRGGKAVHMLIHHR